MIEIATQKKDECPACKYGFVYLLPFSQEDVEELKNYYFNQVLKNRITGKLKERSLVQLRLYWGACRYLAKQLSDHNNLLSADDIDFDIKTRITKDNPSMIKQFKVISGITYIQPISIALPNMKHLEACKYFDKAFPLMGDMIGKTADEFIALVKATFKRR